MLDGLSLVGRMLDGRKILDLPRIGGHRVKQYLEGVGNDNGRHEEEIYQGVQA